MAKKADHPCPCTDHRLHQFKWVSVQHPPASNVLKALHFDEHILTDKECSDCATKGRDWYQLTAIVIATKTQEIVTRTLDVVRKPSAVKDRYDSVTEFVRLLQVLSALYQEKMATKHELGELKPGVWPWDCLVLIQCTKPPDVVKRTAELLAEVGRDEEGKRLKVLSTLYLEKMVTEQNVKDLKAAKWPWKRLVQIQCTKLPDVVKKTAELLAKVGHSDEASLLKVLSTLYQEKMITEKEVVNMKATKSSWSHCIYIQCTKRYNVVKRTAELLAGVEHKEEGNLLEVLATLYQERIVKMKDLKDLTAAAWPWSHCICIQCTNSPNVVTKTAELLAKVGRDEEANLLKVLSTLYQEKMGIDTHDLRLAPWPWSHFICIQCTRPLDVVTRTTKLLAEVRHYEERNLLKVLSTLYQEKMVTEPELEDLKSCEWPWLFLVPIQCTKAPDVVRRTAVLLAEVLRNEEATLLKVLSTLYQEKVVKEKDMKRLTAGDWPWSHCICILCTKGRKVVNKTAELLDEVGYNEEGNLLKVLAALYQKKTIAWRDLQNWKGHAQNMLLSLVLDQCPKSAEDVGTTAYVLREHGCEKEANMLKLLSNMRQKEMIAHHEMKYMRQSAREILWTMVEPVGQPDVKVHGVGEVLWQRLVDLQCRELQKVTAMTKMLDDLGLKEEATQLRVISEIYQKKLISEDDLRCLPHYPCMMGYSSRHWLDSLVDIQSSKSADVHATTFDILRKHSLIDVGNKTQTKHTDVTEYESFMASFSSILVKSEKLPTLYTMRTLKQWSMLSEHLRSKAPPPTPMSPAQHSQTGTADSLSVCSPTTRVASSTFAQVLLDHAEEFLKEMNSKEIANKLKAVKLISETVEKDILQSDNKEANVHLLQHLKRDADEKTVTEIFRIASKTADNGKMSVFAAGVLRKLERGS